MIDTYFFILTYTIFNLIVLFGGIFLTKFFTDKFEWRKPYKPAILVNVIWILITIFVLSFLIDLITSYVINIDGYLDLFTLVNAISSIIILFLNFIIIALLIKVFYKNSLKDSIFISLAVISFQVFIRIIVANVLSIIFILTTGGIISFYVFQFV